MIRTKKWVRNPGVSSSKPVLGLDGTYCSPACGAGCSRAAFENAQDKSKVLAKVMGKGWKPVVWENMGWHWKVVKGPAHIVPSIGVDKHYFTYFSSVKQFIGQHNNPQKALVLAIREARRHVKALQKDLKGF